MDKDKPTNFVEGVVEFRDKLDKQMKKTIQWFVKDVKGL